MSDEPIEPPDPELRRLFEAESRAPDAPAAMKARVWTGVQRGLDGPPGGAEGGPGGGGVHGGAAGVSASAVALVAFVVGAGVGAGVYHLTASTPAPTAAFERPAEPMNPDASDAAATPLTAESPPTGPPPIAPAAAPDSAPPAEPRPPDAGPAPKRPVSPPEPPPPQNTLAQEQALVEIARAALARGQTAASLEAIERHARAFPDGQLAEEREALRVLTLAGAERMTEARRAADRFRARYPRSLLQRPIDAALGGRR